MCYVGRVSVLCAAAVFMVAASPSAAEESWQPLLARAPADANTLVMIQAEKIRGSKFAQTTGWDAGDAPPGGLRSILPRHEIRRALLASRLNLLDLSEHWQVGILETASDPSLELFAGGVRAPVETLGTTQAVRLPTDAYLMKLAPKLFGILGPADRQRAAQWVRTSAAGKPLESTYLQKIASFPETIGTEIMLGFDLTDAADPATVTKLLQTSPTIREAQFDAAQAAQIVASIEGVALGVRVLDQATGMIRVDFRTDPSPLAKWIKPLLLERLAARGVLIDDFQTWTLDLKGNTAFVGGTLSPTGLSLLLSIVEPDVPPEPTATGSLKTTTNSTQKQLETAEKSKKHFRQVSGLVTEIRFPHSVSFHSAGAFGGWIDRQARRIDNMPILGVDPDLVDYSAGVAKSLRVTAQKQRGATISASTASIRSTRYLGDIQDYVTESPMQIQTRMETAAANLAHVDIMRMIDDETAAMRRKMTERYQIEF
jgi:hypothetical protein